MFHYRTSKVKVFAVLFISLNFTVCVYLVITPMPTYFLFHPVFSSCSLFFCLVCLLVKEFLPSAVALYSFFCYTFLSPTFLICFHSFLFTFFDTETSARLIDPSPPYIKNKLDSLFPLTDWYIFLFLGEGNVISKYKQSLNCGKATGGKFVLMPMFHLVPLQTK